MNLVVITNNAELAQRTLVRSGAPADAVHGRRVSWVASNGDVARLRGLDRRSTKLLFLTYGGFSNHADDRELGKLTDRFESIGTREAVAILQSPEI